MSAHMRNGMLKRRSAARFTLGATSAAVACALTMCGAASAATTLLDEPFTGTAGNQPNGFVAYTNTANINSQLDGNGEYEQRIVSSGGGSAIGWYDQPDITNLGAWRDTTTDVLLRYSGGGNDKNGLVIRARDVTDPNSGDYYHVRVEGDALVLYRVHNGSFANIASTSVGGSLSSITDRLLQVNVKNVANPGTDHVRLQITLYNGTTEASGALRTINFLDTSADAVTRAGGVGMRTNFPSGTTGQRATFDDLLVQSNNTSLRWYDDYQDNSAVKMQNFVDGSANVEVTGEKYQFDRVQNGSRSLALINDPTETSNSNWANVTATTLMRLNTLANGGQLSAGLILRETGVTGANNGSGDYYHYRLVHDESANVYAAQLYRVIDGTFSLLSSTTLSAADVPESENIFLKFTALNEGGDVHLVGLASFTQDFASTFGLVDYLDSSADRILGPGSAGFRVFGGGGIGSGTVNFDNFTVTSIPTPAALPAGLALLMGFARRRRRRTT